MLAKFCKSFRYKINTPKTYICFSLNVAVNKAIRINKDFGFKVPTDLGMYLRVPLLHDIITKDTYRYILEKVRLKLSGWSASYLSMAGRLTLAKSVLMAISTYAIQTTALPTSFCDQIDRLV